MIKKGYETIKTDEDDDNHSATHPASSANFLSLLTCWWMNSTFRTGNKRPLNQSDFLPLNEEDRTRDQTERLQELWDFEVQRCSTNADRKPKLWKCFLMMLSCKEVLFLLSFWFLESIFMVSVPLVLGLLLSSLNSAEIDRPLVYGCCLIIGMTEVFAATTYYAEFRCDLLGMRLSSALKGIIYRKVSDNWMKSFRCFVSFLLLFSSSSTDLLFPSSVIIIIFVTIIMIKFFVVVVFPNGTWCFGEENTILRRFIVFNNK